jgi:hypothetical protein
MNITVYVPMSGSRMQHEIEQGAGIVGPATDPSEDLRLVIDEVASSDLVDGPASTFADRVAIAAEQHLHEPIRRSLVDRGGFAAVGSWDYGQRLLSLRPDCSSIVAAWLGCETISPRELQVSRS